MPLPGSPSILFAAASVTLILAVFFHARTNQVWGVTFGVVMLFAGYGIVTDPVRPGELSATAVNSVWSHDSLAHAEQWVVMAFGLLTGIAIFDARRSEQSVRSSYGYLMFTAGGLLLVAQANDFVALGLSLEIVQLSIVAISRSERWNSTSQMGSDANRIEEWQSSHNWIAWVASGCFWLGVAILSNGLSTTHFDQIRIALSNAYDPGMNHDSIGSPSKLILLAVGLIAMSLFARMGLVPFQMGITATFQSFLDRSTGFTMQAGQLAGAISLTRLFSHVWIGIGHSSTVLVMVVTLATSVLTAVLAMRCFMPGLRSMKFLVASLFLFHSAWFDVGLMTAVAELEHPATRWGAFAGQSESLTWIVFAQLAGLFAMCGVYSTLNYVARFDRGIEFVEDVRGMGQSSLVASMALIVAFASGVGCPFTAGFWSRWMMMIAADNSHAKTTSSIFTPHDAIRISIFVCLIASLFLATVIIRLAREMFLESPLGRSNTSGGRSALLASVITAIATVLFGVFPQLALVPLKTTYSPRESHRQVPQQGSGKNSFGFRIEAFGSREAGVALGQ